MVNPSKCRPPSLSRIFDSNYQPTTQLHTSQFYTTIFTRCTPDLHCFYRGLGRGGPPSCNPRVSGDPRPGQRAKLICSEFCTSFTSNLHLDYTSFTPPLLHIYTSLILRRARPGALVRVRIINTLNAPASLLRAQITLEVV